MTLKAKKLHPDAVIPTRAYEGDLGFDLYSIEEKIIRAGDSKKIQTGIGVEFPIGWGGFIKARSSQGQRGLDVFGGVIDNGYRGPLDVTIFNSTPEQGGLDNEGNYYCNDIFIGKGEKVGQLIPIPLFTGGIQEIEEFTNTTERGEKGFGSSGK